MFELFFLILVLLIIFICLFIMKSIQKLNIFQKINNKFLVWLISFIPLLLIFIILGFINGIVVVFHLFIFLLISNLIMIIISKVNKRKTNDTVSVILGVFLAVVYLVIGAYNCFDISRTNYEIQTNKDIGSSSFRIIQISDTHMGTTFDGNGFKKEIEKISKIDSDIVVITGDFVDDDTTKEDMITSCEALSLLKPKYGIYYVYGNHDKGYYNSRNFSSSDLEIELGKNGVNVLKDEVVKINNNIYLIGRNDKSFERKSIEELTSDIDKSKYIIDLNHQPNDYENEKNNVDLVLSGHSHGGQLIPLGYVGKLLKSNDEFYGLHKRGNTSFIVNSGMSNWALFFKTGTHSEYTVIDIVGSAVNE